MDALNSVRLSQASIAQVAPLQVRTNAKRSAEMELESVLSINVMTVTLLIKMVAAVCAR